MSLEKLTPGERQVVALKCDYYRHHEVASKLGISITTVQNRLNAACLKFSAVTHGELLRRARLAGIDAGATT